MRKILATISDGHAGFTRGLCNPNVVLFDETPGGDPKPFHPQLSEWSKHLWWLHEKAREYTRRLAGDDEIVVLFKGDPTHGNRFYSELVSTSHANQILMAIANAEVWLEMDNVTTARLAIGTESHEFGEGSATHLIVKGLTHYRKGVRAVNHGLIDLAGIKIDYAHHGPGGGIRKWTEGNVARLYLQSLMWNEIIHGKKPPDLVLRGHVHIYKRVWWEVGKHSSWLVILPSMSGMSLYGRKATQSNPYITNGITLFEIVDGSIVKMHPLHLEKDTRTREFL